MVQGNKKSSAEYCAATCEDRYSPSAPPLRHALHIESCLAISRNCVPEGKLRYFTSNCRLSGPCLPLFLFCRPLIFGNTANALVWLCPLEQLDYDHYLPMFFDGIRCLEDPCKMLARQVTKYLRSKEQTFALSMTLHNILNSRLCRSNMPSERFWGFVILSTQYA